MVKINLLPDVVLERRRMTRIKRLANVGFVAWLALVGLVVFGIFSYSTFQNFRLSRSKQARDQLYAQVHSAENDAFRDEALQVQASLDALSELFATRYSIADFTQAVSNSTPRNVAISDISMDSDLNVSFSGSALSYADVGIFEKALKDSASKTANGEKGAYFTGIILLGANRSSESLVRFNIQAKYVPAAGLEDSAGGGTGE